MKAEIPFHLVKGGCGEGALVTVKYEDNERGEAVVLPPARRAVLLCSWKLNLAIALSLHRWQGLYVCLLLVANSSVEG